MFLKIVTVDLKFTFSNKYQLVSNLRHHLIQCQHKLLRHRFVQVVNNHHRSKFYIRFSGRWNINRSPKNFFSLNNFIDIMIHFTICICSVQQQKIFKIEVQCFVFVIRGIPIPTTRCFKLCSWIFPNVLIHCHSIAPQLFLSIQIYIDIHSHLFKFHGVFCSTSFTRLLRPHKLKSLILNWFIISLAINVQHQRFTIIHHFTICQSWFVTIV